MTISRKEQKEKGIRWVEEDENDAPNALPRKRGTEIYIELRGLNTGSKRISHTVTGPEALRSQCRFSEGSASRCKFDLDLARISDATSFPYCSAS